ncbi:hypothetical protein BH09BAC6_BH09BAC6_36510 [soil metagenome]
MNYRCFTTALFKSNPDSAAIPPTKPPINAVSSSNKTQLCRGNTSAMRFAMICSLGILLNKANTVHTINTAAKPEKKEEPGFLPMK